VPLLEDPSEDDPLLRPGASARTLRREGAIGGACCGSLLSLGGVGSALGEFHILVVALVVEPSATLCSPPCRVTDTGKGDSEQEVCVCVWRGSGIGAACSLR
jgi:hypothetical protein